VIADALDRHVARKTLALDRHAQEVLPCLTHARLDLARGQIGAERLAQERARGVGVAAIERVRDAREPADHALAQRERQARESAEHDTHELVLDVRHESVARARDLDARHRPIAAQTGRQMIALRELLNH
jgi:hypothetical protein